MVCHGHSTPPRPTAMAIIDNVPIHLLSFVRTKTSSKMVFLAICANDCDVDMALTRLYFTKWAYGRHLRVAQWRWRPRFRRRGSEEEWRWGFETKVGAGVNIIRRAIYSAICSATEISLKRRATASCTPTTTRCQLGCISHRNSVDTVVSLGKAVRTVASDIKLASALSI